LPNIFKILDEPVGEWIPNGYLFCPSCGRYEHHPFIYCPACGVKYLLEKKMTWRGFIRKTAKHGSGPINTVWYFLRDRLPDVNGEVTTRPDGTKFYWDMNKQAKAIYKEANEIWENASKEPYDFPPHKFCEICGNLKGHNDTLRSFCSEECKGVFRKLCERDDGGKQHLADQLRTELKLQV